MNRQIGERFIRHAKSEVRFCFNGPGNRSRRCFFTTQQPFPHGIRAISERGNPPHAQDAETHAVLLRIRIDALVPPNPNELESTVVIDAARALFATMLRSTSTSGSRKLIFAGRNWCCNARRQKISSIAPAAPSEWPIILLVELIGTRRPNSWLIAFPSAACLNGVAVPCALM